MDLELRQRQNGYGEAVLAQLVAVSRLAADIVSDLRLNQEPLLAEVFGVRGIDKVRGQPHGGQVGAPIAHSWDKRDRS